MIGLRRGDVCVYAVWYVFVSRPEKKPGAWGFSFLSPSREGRLILSDFFPGIGVVYGNGRHFETISPSDLVEGVRVQYNHPRPTFSRIAHTPKREKEDTDNIASRSA